MPGLQPGQQFLIQLQLEDGYLTTRSGAKIRALRWGSIYRVLLESITKSGTNVSVVTDFPIDDLEIGTNCHGVTFAHSQFIIINNPEVLSLLRDQYAPCDEARADVVVLFDQTEAVHSAARVKEAGTNYYRSKNGVYKERQVATVSEVAELFPGCTPQFYRLKTQ